MAFPVFESHSAKLWYYFALTAGCFFSAGTFPMIDAMVLSILEADPSAGKDYYGSQKAFGTVSHNVTTWFIHKFYEMNGQDFLCHVLFGCGYDGCACLCHPLVSPITWRSRRTSITDPPRKPPNSMNKSPRRQQYHRSHYEWQFLHLLTFNSCRWYCSFRQHHQSPVYLTDYLKFDKSVLGNLMIIGRMIPELALLFYAKSIMVKVGPHWFMILGQAAGVVRILLYLLLKPLNPDTDFISVFWSLLKCSRCQFISRFGWCFPYRFWFGPACLVRFRSNFGRWLLAGISMAVAAIISKLILAYMGDGDDGLYYVFGSPELSVSSPSFSSSSITPSLTRSSSPSLNNRWGWGWGYDVSKTRTRWLKHKNKTQNNFKQLQL